MVTLYSLGLNTGQLSSISITLIIKSAIVDNGGSPGRVRKDVSTLDLSTSLKISQTSILTKVGFHCKVFLNTFINGTGEQST